MRGMRGAASVSVFPVKHQASTPVGVGGKKACMASVRRPEQASSQGRKVAWRLPGAGGERGGRVIFYGYLVFVGDEEKILDIVMLFIPHCEGI